MNRFWERDRHEKQRSLASARRWHVLAPAGLLVATLAVGRALPAAVPAPGETDAARVTLEELAWLAGTWAGQKDGVHSEELWTAAAGGMMLGLHRDVRPGSKAFFEFLRIEATPDGLAYIASPAGQPAKAFPLLGAGDRSVVFGDPQHDFPQRLTYRREGDRLHVRAEGQGRQGPRVLEWTWELRDRCPGTAGN